MSVLGDRILYEDRNKSTVRAVKIFVMCATNKKRFDFTQASVLCKKSSLNNSQNNAKWDICSLKTKYFYKTNICQHMK